MEFIQESTHPKELGELYRYLQERPGSLIDFKKIQRHIGTNLKVIHELFEELSEKNIGTLLTPFTHENFKAPQTNHAKFYFNDESYLLEKSAYRADQSGALFEQLFFVKIKKLVTNIWFMRTSDGIEVDFIIQTPQGDFYALELQKDQFIYAADLQGLHFFNNTFPEVKKLIVLHMGTRDNCEGSVLIMPHEKVFTLL